MSDWEAHVDPSSGNTYYYNATTGETSWEPPAGFAAAPAASSLPSEWQEGYDESTGKTYYYNTVTGETSWDPPAAQEDTVGALPTYKSTGKYTVSFFINNIRLSLTPAALLSLSDHCQSKVALAVKVLF